MAARIVCAKLIVLMALAGGETRGEPAALRESARPGQVTRVNIELKAEGQYRPQVEPAEAKGNDAAAKALALKVNTRLEFAEKVVAAGPDGAARRVVRKVDQAAAAIGGDVRPIGSQLRPEVALLVAERRDGRVTAFSPGGPLLRPELDLVEAAGDPLALADLLPSKPVAVGDRWEVGADAARALSGYDALALNRLEATLESVDEATAVAALKGEIRGAALGGEGVVSCSGRFTFDRRAGRVASLTLERHEVRKPGPVEAGLDVKSTLTVDRRDAEAPPELADSALDGLPLDPDPGRLLLLFRAPDGRYSFLHDRDWHLFWYDARMTVLKRLDHGEVVAQCNLAVGPDAGQGRHQDPAQFREDVRKALGRRFGQVVGVGELDGTPAGEFRYKVTVQGQESDAPILWHYYLIAAADGRQLLATFTLPAAQSARFADQDGQVIGSIQWGDAVAK